MCSVLCINAGCVQCGVNQGESDSDNGVHGESREI